MVFYIEYHFFLLYIMQRMFDDTKILDDSQQRQKKPGKVKQIIEMIEKIDETNKDGEDNRNKKELQVKDCTRKSIRAVSTGIK